ncbi:MAG: ATP synthase subunit I [Desulfuromonadales bacterium]|nr:ATP synthase subunit I [Desulfuromonadales bacterium]
MMAKDPDDKLLAEIARRNWFILALLLLLSLIWRSLPVTLGVTGGGLLSIGGFLWLQRSLRRLLGEPEPGGERRFQFGFVVRLGVLAILFVLLLKLGAHPLGLAAGLSVVVLNLFWTTFKRAL